MGLYSANLYETYNEEVKKSVIVSKVTMMDILEISQQHYYQGRLTEAIDVLQAAIDAGEDNPRVWLAYATRLVYAIFVLNYDPSSALDALDKVFALAGDDPHLQAACWTQYGRAHYYVGFEEREFDQAVHYLQTASQIQEQIQDDRGLSESSLFLGLIEQFSGNREKAIKLFNKAYGVGMKHPVEKSYAALHIGLLEQQDEQWAASLERFQEAINLRQSVNFMIALPMPYIFAGDSLAELGQTASAHAHYEKAIQFGQEVDHQRAILFAKLSLGILYHDVGDYQRARPYLVEASSLAQKMGHISAQEMAEERISTIP
ncbi:MAG TPA: tetratricopeptide repeat protein [Anaerolineales bacterium]|nr:tetratricopeptide repeat protein [Anaerolineales bacterium]